jgi:hypothetical protein
MPPLLRPDPDVVSRRLEDDVVLVNLRTNRIYSLNKTGARFWELLAEGHGRDAIETQLRAEFDVSSEQLAAEVDQLVTALVSAGLVGEASA